jgi:RinA family phage transcriptional activator
MRREIKAYIEAELKDYNDTLRQIGEDKNELILSSHCPDDSGIRGTDISNPTHNKAVQLMTNKRIRRMEDTCRAIQRVVEALPEDKYKLVELKYWTRPQTRTDQGIAMAINCSIMTYYRWKDGILLALAKEMGLVG